MEYPIHVKLPDGSGFAVANTEVEHIALSLLGYEPAIESQKPDDAAEDVQHTVETVRAALDKLGITYDKRLGLAKLLEMLPA